MYPSLNNRVGLPNAHHGEMESNSGRGQQPHSYNPDLFPATGFGIIPSSLPLPINMNVAQSSTCAWFPTNSTTLGTTVLNQPVHNSFVPCDISSSAPLGMSSFGRAQQFNDLNGPTNTAPSLSSADGILSHQPCHLSSAGVKSPAASAKAGSGAPKTKKKGSSRQTPKNEGGSISGTNIVKAPLFMMVDTRRVNEKEKKRQNREASAGLVKVVRGAAVIPEFPSRNRTNDCFPLIWKFLHPTHCPPPSTL